MSSIRLHLVGGPHHDKEGFFDDQEETSPSVIYVTGEAHGQARIFGAPDHPFIQGPVHRYRDVGIAGNGKHVYNYLPEGT